MTYHPLNINKKLLELFYKDNKINFGYTYQYGKLTLTYIYCWIK